MASSLRFLGRLIVLYILDWVIIMSVSLDLFPRSSGS